MKITSEQLPASQVRFTVEVEGTQSQQIYDQMVKDLVRSVQVPGFRQGKAPKQLVLRQVGAASIKASVIEKMVKDVFGQVLLNHKEITMIAPPTLSPDIEELMNILQYGESLTLTITVDVEPQVTLQGYQNLAIQAERVEPNASTVDDTLHKYRVKHSTLIPVENRGVAVDNVVTVNSETTLVEDGSLVEELSGEDIQVTIDDLALESEMFSMILGMQLEETKEQVITVTPEFPVKEIHGKQIKVKHTLIDIKYRDLPPLDDEFAQSISDKETLEELKEFIWQLEIKEAETDTNKNIEEALTDALLKLIEVEVPISMVEDQITMLMRFHVEQLAELFQGNAEIVKQILTPDHVTEMRNRFAEPALKKVKTALALSTIAHQERLLPNAEAVQERIADYRPALVGKSIDEDRLRQIVKDELMEERALEWLRNHAQIELLPPGTLEPAVDEVSSEDSPATLSAIDTSESTEILVEGDPDE